MVPGGYLPELFGRSLRKLYKCRIAMLYTWNYYKIILNVNCNWKIKFETEKNGLRKNRLGEAKCFFLRQETGCPQGLSSIQWTASEESRDFVPQPREQEPWQQPGWPWKEILPLSPSHTGRQDCDLGNTWITAQRDLELKPQLSCAVTPDPEKRNVINGTILLP